MANKVERAQPRPAQATPRATPQKAGRVAPSPTTSQPLAAPMMMGTPGAAPVPEGVALSASAAPGALWGASPRETAVADFCKLGAAERAQRLTELEAQRDSLKQQINGRCDTLDQRWRYMRLSKRIAALDEYERHSRHLDPETREQLFGVMREAGQHEAAVAALKARYHALGNSDADLAEKAALRSQLRKLLRAESATVKQAVTTVDGSGLRLDRLAETELLIDPRGAAAGTLVSLIDQYVDVSWMVDTFVELSRTAPADEEEQRQQRVEEERLEADIRKDRERRVRALDDLVQFERTGEQRRASMGHVVRGRGSQRDR